jgi:microcystin-dependent protein
MPSTYDPLLRLELQAVGENATTWGTKTNNNLELLAQAISGVIDVPLTGTSYTLTTNNGSSDQARNAVLNFTGTLAANCDVIVPSVDKPYIVRNSTSGGYSVVVKTSAGSGVTVSPGSTQLIYCDSTNVQGPVGGPPTGSMMEFAGASAPSGWLLCDGAAVSRTLYAALFVVLGTTYGAGDGSTTFNLPDRRDKFSVGAGSTYARGSTGGATTTSSAGSHSHTGNTGSTTLTTAQIPAHNHTITDPGHAHGLAGNNGGTTGLIKTYNIASDFAYDLQAGGTNLINTPAATTGITINNTGGGTGHDHTISSDGAHTHTVTPPYVASNVIIKT